MHFHGIVLCASVLLVSPWFLTKTSVYVHFNWHCESRGITNQFIFPIGSCPRESSIAEGDYQTRLTALILARGGSKSIPLKNLAKIDGVSLLGRALRIINNSNGFDGVWVSTDHQSIADEATFFGANVHWRHESTARDESTSLEAVQEFLKGHPDVQNIALIQCTSVFIRKKYLEKAVELFRQSRDVDCVFAVTR